MIKVIVASQNPVKVNATREGFVKVFPDEKVDVEGVVDGAKVSGVSMQPMTSSETMSGALNRVNSVQSLTPDADYWVGIEGGLEETEGKLEAFAWVIIRSKQGKFGKGKTGSFFLPEKIADLIRQGKELGEADDIVFGLKNSKQANGAIGILTGNIITRTTYYEPAVIMALIPFKNPELY
jgi:inosine/xanthosine triphosphatase